MFNFLFFPVSIIPAIISICPFFSLPKKTARLRHSGGEAKKR
jgi:hypothetical protein